MTFCPYMPSAYSRCVAGYLSERVTPYLLTVYISFFAVVLSILLFDDMYIRCYGVGYKNRFPRIAATPFQQHFIGIALRAA